MTGERLSRPRRGLAKDSVASRRAEGQRTPQTTSVRPCQMRDTAPDLVVWSPDRGRSLPRGRPLSRRPRRHPNLDIVDFRPAGRAESRRPTLRDTYVGLGQRGDRPPGALCAPGLRRAAESRSMTRARRPERAPASGRRPAPALQVEIDAPTAQLPPCRAA